MEPAQESGSHSVLEKGPANLYDQISQAISLTVWQPLPTAPGIVLCCLLASLFFF